MKIFTWAVALAILVIGFSVSNAEVAGRMSDPQWFERAPNKLMVLEYESPQHAGSGKQLSELIGQLALSTMNGVQGFAVITLRQDELHLELNPKSVKQLALRQRTPMVIWGEFYKVADKLFLTSHLSIVSSIRSGADPLRFEWNGLGASAPTTQINFAPVEIPEKSVLKLTDIWEMSQALYDKPDASSSQRGTLQPGHPYYLLESSGEWSHVDVKDVGTGWVRLNELKQYDEFKPLTGVILYAQGLVQFFSGNRAAAATSFRDYLRQFALGQDSINQAMAEVLLGYSSIDPAQLTINVENTMSAEKEFQRAANVLPNAASPVNCQAVALMARAKTSNVTADEIRQLERRLLHVIETENDLDAVINLQALYKLPNAADHFANITANFEEARNQKIEILHKLELNLRKQPTAGS